MTAEFLCKASFAIFSVAIAGMDIKTGVVPRGAFAFAFPAFFAFKAISMGQDYLWEPAAGTLLGFAIFLLAFFISKRKLGLADVWYSALTGMLLGPRWWYAAIASACLAGMIYIIISNRRRIPFIPFMAAGSIAVSIWC